MTNSSKTDINLTPKQAKERFIQSAFIVKAMLEGISQPYAIGIFHDLRKADMNLPSAHVHRIIRQIVSTRPYLEATIKAKHRTAIDGSTSELSDENRALAVEKIEKQDRQLQKQKEQKGESVVTNIQTPPLGVKKTRQPVTPVITVKRRKLLTLPKRESAA